jgi:hypothetical protein
MEFKAFTRTLRIKDFFATRGDVDRTFNRKFHVKSSWTPDAKHMSSAMEFALHQLDGIFTDMLHSNNNHARYKHNLSKAQRLAIKHMKSCDGLLHNGDVALRMADKNLGVVMLDKSLDNKLVHSKHLDDHSTYIVVDNVPMEKLKKGLEALIKLFDGEAEAHLVAYFKKSGNNIPIFKILIKLHKIPISSRPIIPAINTITTHISVWAAEEMLEPFEDEVEVLIDSGHLILQLEEMAFDDNVWLFDADVEALFTNIRVPTLSSFIKVKASEKGWPEVRAKRLIRCIEWIMWNNYFTYNGIAYKQIFGQAMGTNVAPPNGNAYMCCMMRKLKQAMLALLMQEVVEQDKPALIRTFQDDIFGIWKGKLEDLIKFLDTINTLDERFKVKYNTNYYSVKFMDLVIYKGPRFRNKGVLDVKVYQKEVNNFLYIPYSSFHSKQVKASFIFTEMDRYATHNSNYKVYKEVKHKFFKRLRARGYPPHFLHTVFAKHNYTRRKQLLKQRRLQAQPRASKAIPCIFKTVHTTRHKQLGLKKFLMEAFNIIKIVPSLGQFHSKAPILCLKRNRNLREVLRPS